MPARFLLDTSICIYIRARQPPAIRKRFESLEPGEAAVSIITFGERLFGAEKNIDRARSMRQLADLAGAIAVLPLPEGTAQAYGTIRAGLETKGRTIGNNDLWIAAHARAAGLILVTNNEREFRRVPELKIENWAKA